MPDGIRGRWPWSCVSGPDVTTCASFDCDLRRSSATPLDYCDVVNTHALDLLQRHGWTPGEPLGAGVEGAVFALDDVTVAKIWHGRSAADLDQLQRFTSALERANLPFGTPGILDTLQDGDQLITIERRLHGQPLRTFAPEPPPVTDQDAQIMGDVLEALAQAPVHPDLAVLPVFAGEKAFDPEAPFRHLLAGLVEHRYSGSRDLLRRAVDGVDDVVNALTERLRTLPALLPSRLLHGDLIPGNVLIEDGRLSAVLDFGFLTTLGDPVFDAAITASIFDMYGPNARTSEDELTKAFSARFDHDPTEYDLYRAAYAVATSTCFSADGSDGHFAWCARMLARPEVRAAAGVG